MTKDMVDNDDENDDDDGGGGGGDNSYDDDRYENDYDSDVGDDKMMAMKMMMM